MWIDNINGCMLCNLCRRKKQTTPRRQHVRPAIFISLLRFNLLLIMGFSVAETLSPSSFTDLLNHDIIANLKIANVKYCFYCI